MAVLFPSSDELIKIQIGSIRPPETSVWITSFWNESNQQKIDYPALNLCIKYNISFAHHFWLGELIFCLILKNGTLYKWVSNSDCVLPPASG